jgi:hypothetical protein
MFDLADVSVIADSYQYGIAVLLQAEIFFRESKRARTMRCSPTGDCSSFAFQPRANRARG